jgi:tetratricopeptide (TPR) repeat protein
MRRRSPAAVIAVFFLVFSLVGLAGVARADEVETRAVQLFEQSERAYDAGRFNEALRLLDQAYALKKEPVLLYNMGRAHEGAGNLRAAADKYEEFLRAAPDAPDRGALEKRIATLRRQLAERDALAKKAGTPTDEHHGAGAVPWIVGGVGVAGLGTGIVFGVLANGKHNSAVKEPTGAESDRLNSQARSFASVADVCIIAGAVLLVAGAIWVATDR